MRVLVLALLLANMLYFGWQHWVINRRPPALPDPYLNVARLELAPDASGTPGIMQTTAPDSQALGQEGVGGSPQANAGNVIATPTVTTPPQVCASLGPFAERSGAEAAIAKMGLSVFEPILHELRSVSTSYWVYLPPFLDRQSANRALQALAQRGIKDAYVVGDGADRQAIALGLYSESERADKRVAQVQQVGMTARIRAQQNVRVDYAISLVLPGLNVLDVGQLRSVAGDGVVLRQVACDAPGPDKPANEQP